MDARIVGLVYCDVWRMLIGWNTRFFSNFCRAALCIAQSMRWRAVRLHIVSRRRSCIVSKWLNTSSNYFQRQEASRSLCATAELLVSCPSHVGILGNEKASAAAKSALSLPVTPMKLPATDMYLRITKMIFDEWQEVCGIAAPEINCMLLDLTSNNLLNPHQSAYCKHHSTETALLYIHTITLLML